MIIVGPLIMDFNFLQDTLHIHNYS